MCALYIVNADPRKSTPRSDPSRPRLSTTRSLERRPRQAPVGRHTYNTYIPFQSDAREKQSVNATRPLVKLASVQRRVSTIAALPSSCVKRRCPRARLVSERGKRLTPLFDSLAILTNWLPFSPALAETIRPDGTSVHTQCTYTRTEHRTLGRSTPYNDAGVDGEARCVGCRVRNARLTYSARQITEASSCSDSADAPRTLGEAPLSCTYLTLAPVA